MGEGFAVAAEDELADGAGGELPAGRLGEVVVGGEGSEFFGEAEFGGGAEVGVGLILCGGAGHWGTLAKAFLV